jgi:hypothetical protein
MITKFTIREKVVHIKIEHLTQSFSACARFSLHHPKHAHELAQGFCFVAYYPRRLCRQTHVLSFRIVPLAGVKDTVALICQLALCLKPTP